MAKILVFSRRLLIFLICGAPMLIQALGSGAGDAHRWSLANWEDWRDNQIRKILEPTFEEGGERTLVREEVIQKANEAYQFLAPFLSDPEFLANGDRSRALGNFIRFVKAEHWMAVTSSAGTPTNALGMDITDKEYWSFASPYLRFPSLLVSQPFLKLMNSPNGYQSAVKLIEAQNRSLPAGQQWIVFPFRAQFIQSVDLTTYGRLLVLVPNVGLPDGRLLDRWILFALATPDLKPVPRVRSVSMISILRDPSVSGVSKAYFSDFMREKDPTGEEITAKPNLLMEPSPSKNCYDCHKSAVLPIFPKTAFEFGTNGELVSASGDNAKIDKINLLIRQYGRTEIEHLDQEGFGPDLGPVGSSISDSFIADSTSDRPVSASSYGKIRTGMMCSGCHDSFAKINFLLAVRSDRDVKVFESKKGLLQTIIENGYMPPNNSLTTSERHALWECVSKQYLDLSRTSGIFVDWLRGTDSSSTTAP